MDASPPTPSRAPEAPVRNIYALDTGSVGSQRRGATPIISAPNSRVASAEQVPWRLSTAYYSTG